MQDKFSVRRLLELVIEAIGEGELQDSILIGTIQFLLPIKTIDVRFVRCHSMMKILHRLTQMRRAISIHSRKSCN